MRNIILKIQYDGKNYHGWQRQINAITIQEVLENSLEKFFKQKVIVRGCGRTDAGVHALSFICNFYVESKVKESSIVQGMNSILAKDIVVLDCKNASIDFDSLNDCIGKKYRYRILNRGLPSAFEQDYSWHYPYKVDIDLVKKASNIFIGYHDFKAFMASGSSIKGTIRNIFDINVGQKEDKISIEISADGFLYNMVRIIVGTLIYIGNRKIRLEDLSDIIKSRDRTKAGITAPAQGLYLVESYYK